MVERAINGTYMSHVTLSMGHIATSTSGAHDRPATRSTTYTDAPLRVTLQILPTERQLDGAVRVSWDVGVWRMDSAIKLAPCLLEGQKWLNLTSSWCG